MDDQPVRVEAMHDGAGGGPAAELVTII